MQHAHLCDGSQTFFLSLVTVQLVLEGMSLSCCSETLACLRQDAPVQVNDSYRGTLSSYCYVLMCIHLLQQRQPAILPCLQTLKPATYQR